MNKFIELTNAAGNPVLINVANINAVTTINGNVYISFAFDHDTTMGVKESYEQVKALIVGEVVPRETIQQFEDRIAQETRERNPELWKEMCGHSPVVDIVPGPYQETFEQRDSTGKPHNCNVSIMNLGKPLPRTCKRCGLGPCPYNR